MVVVDDVETAVREIHVAHARHGIGREHRDSHLREHLGESVVDEFVVVVRARRKHHRIAALGPHALEHLLATELHLVGKRRLRGFGLFDRPVGERRLDPKGVHEIALELSVAVLGVVPVKERRVEGNAKTLLGVVGILHHVGVALDHRAHPLTRLGGILGGNRGDDGHEDPVGVFTHKVAHMAVHELGRKADGVGGDVRQPLLEHLAR